MNAGRRPRRLVKQRQCASKVQVRIVRYQTCDGQSGQRLIYQNGGRIGVLEIESCRRGIKRSDGSLAVAVPVAGKERPARHPVAEGLVRRAAAEGMTHVNARGGLTGIRYAHARQQVDGICRAVAVEIDAEMNGVWIQSVPGLRAGVGECACEALCLSCRP